MKDEIAKRISNDSVSNYDKIAEDFSASRAYFWKELEFAKEFMKDEQTVIDVGCGNGRFFEVIKNKKVDYTGIDASEKLINIARQRYPSIKFLVADALELPFKNQTFDIAVSFAVLHHIPSRKLRENFLNEIGRVLKKDGILILSVWNLWQRKYLPAIIRSGALKIFGLSELDFKDFYMNFGKLKNARYLHAFTKKELRKLISRKFLLEKLITAKRESGQSNFLVIARKI